MKITVIGAGYVGLVTGTCFAQMGNHVICVDVDVNKVDKLNKGISPIYEPGLEERLAQNLAEGRLSFVADTKAAITNTEIIFITVGTPSDHDGSADLHYVLDVANTIGECIEKYTVVVTKSTVPVGTADKVQNSILQALKKRGKSVTFDVVSNPEFLKEGAAVDDCMRPDRIIIGSASDKATTLMQQLYAPFNRNHDKLMVMGVRSAEMTKYVANAMLATKISFMNEMSQIAEKVGADIEQVRRGIGADSRIGYSFIYPGCGYGGSCFPKDVRALMHSAKSNGYEPSMLNAVDTVNDRQKDVLFYKILGHFKEDIANKTFALWGLSFKPNTDDIREASSIALIEKLLKYGAKIRAFDPVAMDNVRTYFGDRDDIALCVSTEDTLEGADALVVVTEWMQFRSPDFSLIKENLSAPVIFDGRNLYDIQYLVSIGFTCYAMGRGAILNQGNSTSIAANTDHVDSQ